MKFTKILIVAFMLLVGIVSVSEAAKVRVSLMFVHYSVGNQILSASCYDQNLYEILDTMTVTYGTDTARIVFRDYHLNYWSSGPLSDTLVGCTENRFGGFDYDLRTSSYDRTKIWNSWDGVNGQFAGFVNDFFHVPNKENQPFWEMFNSHQVPATGGGTETEFYDMVMVKNPYICWSFMTQSQADSIQKFYSIIRDSVAAHPEIRLGLVFGTPRLRGDTVDDSTQAKITYNLLQWFNSDAFFRHSNSGTYKNLWKFDSYTPLIEMNNNPDKYSMVPSYSAGAGNSHLSRDGSVVALESFLGFIREASYDILVIKSGLVTREDIDLKIKEFKEGSATEQDVHNLIEQYNNQSNP